MGYKFLLMGTLRFFFNEIICKIIFYADFKEVGLNVSINLNSPFKLKKKSFIKNLL